MKKRVIKIWKIELQNCFVAPYIYETIPVITYIQEVKWFFNLFTYYKIKQINQMEKIDMTSEIVWKTGNPKENGEYLVTRYSPLGKGRTYVQTNYYCNGKWLVEVLDASYVTAWCLLSDIKPL